MDVCEAVSARRVGMAAIAARFCLPAAPPRHMLPFNPSCSAGPRVDAARNNRLSADGARALAAALPHVPQLQTLILRYNNMGVEGAKALAAALLHVPQLQTLNLLYVSQWHGLRAARGVWAGGAYVYPSAAALPCRRPPRRFLTVPSRVLRVSCPRLCIRSDLRVPGAPNQAQRAPRRWLQLCATCHSCRRSTSGASLICLAVGGRTGSLCAPTGRPRTCCC
jgi:hypothetical protein